MNQKMELGLEQVGASQLPRAFRIRVTGGTLLTASQNDFRHFKSFVLDAAQKCGMTVFECAIGRTFLPVYSASGKPTAAVEAVVFDASDPTLRLMLEREGVQALPVVEAKRTEAGWMFEVPGSR